MSYSLGENGGDLTTMALNEEGGGGISLPVPNLTDEEFKKIKELIEKFIKEHHIN